MVKKRDPFEKALDASLRGGLALQSVPLLSKSGRTPTALAGTAEGFLGITVAGGIAKTGFSALKASHEAFKKKRGKLKRR